jgi:arsenate reductase
MFSDSFAGIAPSSVPTFIGDRLLGGTLAVVAVKVLYPGVTPQEAADVVFPHHGLSATPTTVVSPRGRTDDASSAPATRGRR